MVAVVFAVTLIAGLLLWLQYDEPEGKYADPVVRPKADPLAPLDIVSTPLELEIKAQSKERGPDPYLPTSFYTKEQHERIIGRAKQLENENKVCFEKFISKYQDTLFQHCQKHSLGEDAEGGCESLAYKYSIHTRVVEEALISCLKKVDQDR